MPRQWSLVDICLNRQTQKFMRNSRRAERRTSKGRFPVMAKITRILAANIRRQFFFVITNTASTRCLVQNFQLICYSQRVNATSQYNDSGSSRCSKWPNDRMVAVVKHCRLLVQGRRGWQRKMTDDYYWIGVQENIK